MCVSFRQTKNVMEVLSTVEKEAYTIYYTIDKLYFYLHNSKVTINTDHMPLIHLMSSPFDNAGSSVEIWLHV